MLPKNVAFFWPQQKSIKQKCWSLVMETFTMFDIISIKNIVLLVLSVTTATTLYICTAIYTQFNTKHSCTKYFSHFTNKEEANKPEIILSP